MATKNLTDRGINGTAITFEKNGPGNPTCEVQIRTTAGTQESVTVDVTTALTGAERTALAALLVKLYNAGVALAGYA